MTQNVESFINKLFIKLVYFFLEPDLHLHGSHRSENLKGTTFSLLESAFGFEPKNLISFQLSLRNKILPKFLPKLHL